MMDSQPLLLIRQTYCLLKCVHLYVEHVAKLYYITNENNLSTGSRRISFFDFWTYTAPPPQQGRSCHLQATPPPCFAQAGAGKIQDQW